jgi:hypothetical protein
MTVAYKAILLGTAFNLISRSVPAQVLPPVAEVFPMLGFAGVPIDWTHQCPGSWRSDFR